MIELIPLGHASLVVRSRRAVVWCDPILGDRISGWNRAWPERHVDVERLPAPDAVVVSHHHSDHFSLPDLAGVPGIDRVPVIVPRGFPRRADLAAMGVRVIVELSPFEVCALGDLTVTATPSDVAFPEMGVLFASGTTRVLHLVDTVFDPLLTDSRGSVAHGCDLALVPFQAGGYMSLLPLRMGGPLPGLVEAIRGWATRSTEELVQKLSLLAPARVAPFSDGIAYEDQRINAWHFPLAETAFDHAALTAGLQAVRVEPGRVYRISEGEYSSHRSDAVSELVTASSRHFDPSVAVGNFPFPGPGRGRWNDGLLGRLRPATRAKNWALEVLTADGPPFWLTLDGHPRRHLAQPRRSFGLRMWEGDLVDVLERRIHPDVVELGGVFRYWAPVGTGLEDVRMAVLAPWAEQVRQLGPL